MVSPPLITGYKATLSRPEVDLAKLRLILESMSVESISFSIGYPTEEWKSNLTVVYKVPHESPLRDAHEIADKAVDAFHLGQTGITRSYLVHRYTDWLHPGPSHFEFGWN